MRVKTVVITGISSGVGKKATEKFLKLGYNVVGLSRNIKKIKKQKNLTCIECDISKIKSVKKAFSKIVTIDILINNASLFTSKKITDVNYSDVDKIIDTNLKGTIFCTMESLKKMKKGRIINIGSVSGLHGIANQTIYSSSKFGVMGFSESLSQELENINITTICPGGINTPLWSDVNKYNGDVNDLLTTDNIVSTILYVTSLEDNVVVKEITIFPKCEWH